MVDVSKSRGSGPTGTVGETASETYAKAKHVTSNLAERGSAMLPQSATRSIEENPLTAAVTAAMAGWLVGMLRRSSSSSGRAVARQSTPGSWSATARSRGWNSQSNFEDAARTIGREVSEQPIPVVAALAIGYALAWGIHGEGRSRQRG
jgi:hypothetical protein